MSDIQHVPHIQNAVIGVPVEIWYKIFRLILGPSISDPHQLSLQAYKNAVFIECTVALFNSSRAIFRRYKDTEGKRAPLRRTCRRWKDIVDALDDQIVVLCPDGFTWPPGRDTKDAKRIIYFWTTIDPSYGFTPPDMRCPVSIARENAIDWQPKEHIQATDGYPAPVDPTDYIAPVMDVINCLLDIPEGKPVLVPSEKLPRTLQYQYHGKHPNALRGLWHPVFHHLTSLHLRTDFPFRWSYPLGRLSLPDLHYLYLKITWKASDLSGSPLEEDIGTSVATWRFPKLRMFGLDMSMVHQALKDDVSVLVAAHADTLEEVELLDSMGSEVAKVVEWSKFNVLKTLHITELDVTPPIILALPGRSAIPYESSPSESARLEVYFASRYLSTVAVDSFNDAIREYPDAFSRVIFRLDSYRWEDVLNSFLFRGIPREMTHLLSPSFKTVKLAMFDAAEQPIDSTAALHAREAVIQAEIENQQRALLASNI